jgi:hypothetical protein
MGWSAAGVWCSFPPVSCEPYPTIVSVLDDLEACAKANELPWFWEKLTKTKLTAIYEMNGDLERLQGLAHSAKRPPKHH